MFEVLDSDDLEKLSRAIDARCRELSIRPDSIDGLMVASQLLGLFQSGLTDETALSTHPIALHIGPPNGRRTNT